MGMASIYGQRPSSDAMSCISSSPAAAAGSVQSLVPLDKAACLQPQLKHLQAAQQCLLPGARDVTAQADTGLDQVSEEVATICAMTLVGNSILS